MSKNYKYNEATVRFYDILYDNFTGIERGGKQRAQFYHEEISKARGAILEAGAGTGMIFVPALKAGADIYGIDQSELMFERLNSKLNESERYRVSLQDIREFKLDKQFSLVISPFRVFQHLLTIEDQLKALGRIYEHLEDGGLFIFDLFCPDLTRLHSEVKEMLEFDSEYEPGKRIQRYFSVMPDYINQIQNITFKYVWNENGEEKYSEYDFPMRYYFRFELMNLLARANFKVKNIYGSFERDELNNNSKEFVIICEK